LKKTTQINKKNKSMEMSQAELKPLNIIDAATHTHSRCEIHSVRGSTKVIGSFIAANIEILGSIGLTYES
jgi:hypothetical protein